MKTKIVDVREEKDKDCIYEDAGHMIRSGELVAFMTETVYGLGANALDGDAVLKIFAVKNRPADNPLIVHISDKSQLDSLIESCDDDVFRLMDAFWPGPLTLVMKKSPEVPFEVSAGLDSVAVRMPDNPVALGLICSSKRPIAAPSANSSTRPSPTRASHVYDDLKGKIRLILDGGECDVGLESTVVDTTQRPYTILRPGKISLEEIRRVVPGSVLNGSSLKDKECKSPGMKHKHYTPDSFVVVVRGESSDVEKKMDELCSGYRKEGKKCRVLTLETKNAKKYRVFAGSCVQEVAKNIFDIFRRLESDGVDVILTPDFRERGIGVALSDRINRAASLVVDA